jgi:hypothetical protein
LFSKKSPPLSRFLIRETCEDASIRPSRPITATVCNHRSLALPDSTPTIEWGNINRLSNFPVILKIVHALFFSTFFGIKSLMNYGTSHSKTNLTGFAMGSPIFLFFFLNIVG